MKQFFEAQLRVRSSNGEEKIYIMSQHSGFGRSVTLIIYGPHLARPDANMDRLNCSLYGHTKGIGPKPNGCNI
jgi:branched-subunit amino acid aminotransferase/4-amino-4-deoxychorismate lyase